MANDCLVKRLKGVVDNDNLRTLGGIIVTFKDLDENPNIVFYCTGSYKVKAKRGRFNILQYSTTTIVASDQTNYTGNGNVCIAPAEAGTIVEFTSKYSIDGIGYNTAYDNPSSNHVVVNASDLNYSSIINLYNNLGLKTRIRYSEGTIDFGTLPNISNTSTICISQEERYTALRVVVPESLIFGDNIEIFAITNSIAGLDDRKVADLNLTSFHRAINLQDLDVPLSSLVRGDIKQLFDALHENGKISGSLSIQGVGTKMTYDGESLDNAFWNDHDYAITATFTSDGWTSNY